MGEHKPKKQHFIPVSYLKAFAEEIEPEKFVVEARRKGESDVKSIGVKDICAIKNLYTLPLMEDGKKYTLENFYAKEIDGVYPDVYKLLVNPEKRFITNEEKEKIIYTTMSLYFRTPKFIESKIKEIDAVFDYALLNHKDANGHVKFVHKEYNLDFNVEEFDTVKDSAKVYQRFLFLKNHVNDWHEFSKFKMKAGISVITVTGTHLITSDSPVHIHDIWGNLDNIFDPNNMIQLPLNSKDYLIIYPNNMDAIPNIIFRNERDKMAAVSLNHSTERNSIGWLIGAKGSIHEHTQQQKAFLSLSGEDLLKEYSARKQGLDDIVELNEIQDKYGPIHEKIFEKAEEMLGNPLYGPDHEMIKNARWILQMKTNT